MTQTKIPIPAQGTSETKGITYLNSTLGLDNITDLFLIQKESIISHGDLDVAKHLAAPAISNSSVVVDNDTGADLDTAVIMTDRILKEVFGDLAYARIADSPDFETGETVVEAHYCWQGDEAELITRHDAFLARYVRELPLPIQSAVELETIPADVDQA